MTELGLDSRARAAETHELLLRLWAALPAFAVSGTAVCLAAGATVLVAGVSSPLTLLLAAVLPGPLYAALVAQAVAALDGNTPPALSLIRFARAALARALTLLLPPAIVGALTLVALLVTARSGSWLPLVAVAVGSSATVLLLVAAVAGLPLGARDPALRGPALILGALNRAARRPVATLGTLAVLVIAGWAADQLSGTLLFLVPPPLAVVSVLAFARSADPDPAGR